MIQLNKTNKTSYVKNEHLNSANFHTRPNKSRYRWHIAKVHKNCRCRTCKSTRQKWDLCQMFQTALYLRQAAAFKVTEREQTGREEWKLVWLSRSWKGHCRPACQINWLSVTCSCYSPWKHLLMYCSSATEHISDALVDPQPVSPGAMTLFQRLKLNLIFLFQLSFCHFCDNRLICVHMIVVVY